MKKRIISTLLCFVLIFAMMSNTFPVFAAGSTSFKMTANVTEAHPSDTITFTVTMGAVNNLSSLRIKLSIPDGLTFVTGSGKITDGIATIMDVDTAEFNEDKLVIYVGASNTNIGYTSSSDTEIMTFQCVVDNDTSGEKTVDFIIDEDEVFEAPSGNYDNIAFDAIPATITVTAAPIHAESIEFSDDETVITISIGDTKELTPIVTPDGYTDTISWSSDNKAIATVDENGVVTGISVGFAYITASVYNSSAICEVEVKEAACTHDTKTSHEAKTATCVAGGWDAYSECTKCGQLFDSNGNEIDTIPSTTIDPDNHSYGNLIPAKEEVHTQVSLEPAVAAHYQCSLCHMYFTEEKAETTLDALTGETPSHSYSDDWTSGETSHWHECECGKKSDEAAHNFEWIIDKAATEDETGLKHEECSECGIKRNENTTIDKLDHVHIDIKHHPAIPATCTDTGTKEYWTCSSEKCAGKYYGDAACMSEIESIIAPIDPNNHKLGDLIEEVPATHTKDDLEAGMKAYYVCEYCDKFFNENKEEVEEADLVIPAPVHNYDKYGKDSDNHWFECTCGAIKDGSIAAHNYNNKKYNETAHWDECICGAKDSSSYAEHTLVKTYDEDTHTFACSGCNYSKTAKHSPEIINFVDATYDSEGYSGDVVCKDCEYLIAKGTVIPKRSFIIIFPPVTDTGNSGTGENESGSETDPVKPEDWTNPFTDITETDECYEAVRFVESEYRTV